MADNHVTRDGRAIWRNIHLGVALIADDISPMSANEQALTGLLNRSFDTYPVDDDDIDAGNFDFSGMATIVMGDTADDPTKMNRTEDLNVPIVSATGEPALDNLKLGDSAGGAGTSWGTLAAQTDIDIAANDHNITEGMALGAITVQASGDINWIRVADLVAGAVVLATLTGDATRAVIVVLPDQTTNEDELPSRGLRIFFGLSEVSLLNEAGLELVDDTIEFLLHAAQLIAVAKLASLMENVSRVGVQNVLPLLADAPLVTGAAAWTYGARVTVINAAVITNPFRIAGIIIEAVSDNTEIYVIELSRLSDDSLIAETKVAATMFNTDSNFGIISDTIEANEGVQVRIATKAGGPDTARISIIYVEMV